MPPHLRGRREQGATFVELFFDLVFVFAVTQLTSVLAHDLTGGGVVRAAIIFWLVWWAWTQFTWSLNEADTEHPWIRLITLTATALAFVMAMTVPDVASVLGWMFAISYLLVRVVGIWLQWLLARGDDAWIRAVRSWTIMSSLGLMAVAVAAVLPPEQRVAALGVAALLDVVAAWRAGSGEWRLFSGHFTERHGLFVIIALGESLIAAGATAAEQPRTAGLLAATISAVVLACGLWWTYFGWVKDALERVMECREGRALGRYARDVFSFAHFPIIAGVIGLAVAIEESIAHPLESLQGPAVAALVAGVILFVGGTAVATAVAGVGVRTVRLVALAALVVSIPSALVVPAWLAIGVAAAIVLVVAAAEGSGDRRAPAI